MARTLPKIDIRRIEGRPRAVFEDGEDTELEVGEYCMALSDAMKFSGLDRVVVRNVTCVEDVPLASVFVMGLDAKAREWREIAARNEADVWRENIDKLCEFARAEVNLTLVINELFGERVYSIPSATTLTVKKDKGYRKVPFLGGEQFIFHHIYVSEKTYRPIAVFKPVKETSYEFLEISHKDIRRLDGYGKIDQLMNAYSTTVISGAGTETIKGKSYETIFMDDLAETTTTKGKSYDTISIDDLVELRQDLAEDQPKKMTKKEIAQKKFEEGKKIYGKNYGAFG